MAAKRDRVSARAVVTSLIISTLLLALVVPGVAAARPAAGNAHRVDGLHAVKAGTTVQNRRGKLVATNARTGRLPNNIIAVAPNAKKLAGRTYRQVLANARTNYTAGPGLTRTGQVFSVDTTTVQSRITATCAAGEYIRTVNADGTVLCGVDDRGTTYTAGTGLSPAEGEFALAGGAATPEHTTSRTAGGFVGGTSMIAGDSTKVGGASLSIQDADGVPHRIMVNGTLALRCTGCVGQGLVTYQLVVRQGTNTSGLIGPPLAASISNSAPQIVLPLTWIGSRDSSAAGTTHTYEILVDLTGLSAGTVSVDSATLTAMDTGRSG